MLRNSSIIHSLMAWFENFGLAVTENVETLKLSLSVSCVTSIPQHYFLGKRTKLPVIKLRLSFNKRIKNYPSTSEIAKEIRFTLTHRHEKLNSLTWKRSWRMRTTRLLKIHASVAARCQYYGGSHKNKFEQVSSHGHQTSLPENTGAGASWVVHVQCPRVTCYFPAQWTPMSGGIRTKGVSVQWCPMFIGGGARRVPVWWGPVHHV